MNTLLEKALSASPNVRVLDLSDTLVGKDGKIDEKLFSDGLHPNREGYERIARKLKRYVK